MSRPGPLLQPVTELRRHLGARNPVTGPVELDGLALSTAWVPAGVEIQLDLVLEAIFDGVTVSGTVTVPWVGECRRCLGEVDGQLEVDVLEVFETRPTEGETWPLVGDEIDLEPVIRDAVLLSLPLAPLCDEDCAGPAPETYPAVVEADQDDEPPDGPPVDPRWAALDQLDLGE